MNQIDRFVKEAEKKYEIHKVKVRILQAAAAVLLVASVIFGKAVLGEAKEEIGLQEEIANEIIRFHVLANSNSKEDQAVKLKVKDQVVSYMQDQLKDCKSKEEAKAVITSKKESMERIAVQVLRENGYDYVVKSELSKEEFPVKKYGDLTFPAGEYDAYRILIGDAEGRNWWCVMFPSLCAVNETYSVVPEESKDTLKNVLTEDEYESIDTEYHFWLVDALNRIF